MATSLKCVIPAKEWMAVRSARVPSGKARKGPSGLALWRDSWLSDAIAKNGCSAVVGQVLGYGK